MARCRSKRWTFTLNNYSPEECEFLKQPREEISYIVIGKEEGREGTPHLQGYVEFCSKKSLLTAKRSLGSERIHIEVSKGSSSENRTYCMKDGDILVEYGEPMQQGKRNDLQNIVEEIKAGVSIPQIWQDFPLQMIRYERGIRSAYKALSPNVAAPPPRFALDAFGWNKEYDWKYSQIMWGAAGIGKTEFAKALLPKALFVSHMDDLVSFDSSIHEGIIFDDMSFTHMPRTAQIHIVDQDNNRSIHCRYTCAHIPANTKKIFLTNESGGNIVDLLDLAIRRRVQIHYLDELNR